MALCRRYICSSVSTWLLLMVHVRQVHHKPKEGVHFKAGELHPEGRVLGDRDVAPHLIVEFTDFFCQHCQDAHHLTISPLLQYYIPQGTPSCSKARHQTK